MTSAVAPADEVPHVRKHRAHFKEFAACKRRCFDLFKARAATLNPILEASDVRGFIETLDHCGVPRPESWLPIPVETFLHILTYLPLYADRFPAAQHTRRLTTIDRVMLSGTLSFVLVMENSHVKQPRNAPRSRIISIEEQKKRHDAVNRIAQAPRKPDGYVELGLLMYDGELIVLDDGRVLSKKQLFAAAYDLDPKDRQAYYNYGLCGVAESTTEVVLPDQRRLQKRDFYVEIVCSCIRERKVLVPCVSAFDRQESCTFPDGTELNFRDVAVRVLQHNPTCVPTLTTLLKYMTKDETILSHTGRSLSRIDIHVQLIESNPKNTTNILNLCKELESDDVVTLCGVPDRTKYHLLGDVLRINPDDATVYAECAAVLKMGECVESPINGASTLSKVQLYVEAIQRNPTSKSSWYDGLAQCLTTEGSKVSFHDGRTLNQREVYVEAVKNCPRSPWMLSRLAQTLSEGELVKLHDGRQMSELQLYKKAHEIDPDPATYLNLSSQLIFGEVVHVDGKALSSRDLQIEAWKLNANLGYVREWLANSLIMDPTPIVLADGPVLTAESELVACLDIDPSNVGARFNVIRLYQQKQTEATVVTLRNGVVLTSLGCLLDIIQMDPENHTPWVQLHLSTQQDVVTLRDGRVMSRKECLLQAYRLNVAKSLHAVINEQFYTVLLTFTMESKSCRGPVSCDGNVLSDYVLKCFGIESGWTLAWLPTGGKKSFVLLRGVSLVDCGFMRAGTYALRRVSDPSDTLFIPSADLTFRHMRGETDAGQEWSAQFRGDDVKAVRTCRGFRLHRVFHMLQNIDAHPNLEHFVGSSLVHCEENPRVHSWLLLEHVDHTVPLVTAVRSMDNATPLRLVIELGLQLCDAVLHLHARGLIHYDVTPLNTLAVVDTPHSTIASVVLGPPIGIRICTQWDPRNANPCVPSINYYSPESCGAFASPLGEACDVYGIGASLWYLATSGRTPWGDEATALDVVGHMLDGMSCPSPLESHPSCACSVELDQLIRACMCLRPEQRPSLSQLRCQLQTFFEAV